MFTGEHVFRIFGVELPVFEGPVSSLELSLSLVVRAERGVSQPKLSFTIVSVAI